MNQTRMDENERLLPIDAVRGIAMFFIGVSHISFYLIDDSGTLATHARAIGYLATPNFLLMSGLACGYQLAHAPTTATALRSMDRGLFAFLVGHLLVTASIVYMVPPGTAFEHVVITDSIGVLLCLAPLLRQVSAQRLLWLGGAVYLLTSLFALGWHPTTRLEIIFGALLLSINDGDMPDIGWATPTLPYLGIFLLGVGLGKLVYLWRRGGRAEVLSARLSIAGSVAIGLALVLNISRHFLKPVLMAHFAPKNWADVILTTINIRHDSPPTLGYGLFYGGIGVLLLGALGLLPRRTPATVWVRMTQQAAVIGQASFVSYVVQQWLIDFVPIWIGFDSWLTPTTCPVYLVFSTLVMYWAALYWGRRKGNRFLTLGLRPGTQSVDSRVGLFAASALVVVFLNVLALANAPRLTPDKLALIPPNPYPGVPAKVARPPQDLVRHQNL
jgi:uncharacterized membrane protein